MNGTLGRIPVVARLAFRASLTGLRGVALVVLALAPTGIVAAIALADPGDAATTATAEGLFLSLTLRVIDVLVLLVVFASAFRSEIELDTLTYLMTRSIDRAGVAVGKYAGALAAALAILAPAALLPLGVAALGGGTAPPIADPVAIAAITVLAAAAYGAIYLLLGLLSPSALVLGLLFGFLWEELVLLLPGSFPRVTVLYYLLSVGARLTASGPLHAFPTVVSLPAAVAGLVGVAVAFVAAAAIVVRSVETAPQRITA
ncbi:MAG TPA: hypothetical protein VLX64_00545 [Thermoplasmata archaeon]|nr:hypothetical protein [Thermoplasmata archaeon]